MWSLALFVVFAVAGGPALARESGFTATGGLGAAYQTFDDETLGDDSTIPAWTLEGGAGWWIGGEWSFAVLARFAFLTASFEETSHDLTSGFFGATGQVWVGDFLNLEIGGGFPLLSVSDANCDSTRRGLRVEKRSVACRESEVRLGRFEDGGVALFFGLGVPLWQSDQHIISANLRSVPIITEDGHFVPIALTLSWQLAP